MTRESDTTPSRRTVLKSLGAAGAAAAMVGTGSAAESHEALGDGLDPNSSLPQESIVVFEEGADVSRLETLDIEAYHEFNAFPMAYTEFTGEQLLEVADWESVMRVTENFHLRLENNDSQKDTNAADVWAGAVNDTEYTGENVHVALIDSGLDGKHPDLVTNVEANYQWVGNPLSDDPELWEDVGPVNTDDLGHGTHCAGSICGTGAGTLDEDGIGPGEEGHYGGMAPDASITSYEVFDAGINPGLVGGPVVTAVKILGAYDDLVTKQREGEHDIHIVSNSWGSGPGNFDPWDPIAAAQWYAYQEDMLVIFSAGNDGDVGNDGLGIRKQAPYVANVAATFADQSVTDFSSRGDVDGNFDREKALENVRDVYRGVKTEDLDRPIEVNRPAVAAKGGLVLSAQSPDQVLYPLAVTLFGPVEKNIEEPMYVPLSGTSMACPTAAGCVALFLDAYIEEYGDVPDPIDTINTIEATADPDAHPDDDDERGEFTGDAADQYTIINAGAGYIDAEAAVERAVDDELADFEELDWDSEDGETPPNEPTDSDEVEVEPVASEAFADD